MYKWANEDEAQRIILESVKVKEKECIKAAYSVTMNIFRKFFRFFF